MAGHSEHFDVLFRRGEDQLAEKALRAAERARKLLLPIFPEAPPRTWIVLADFNDNLNGYALNILYPHMVIFASPPEPSSELSVLDDWLETVILHEYTHNLHLFPATGLWAPLRAVFGSIIAPNGLLPSHFHEGLAVLTETRLTKGGRGNSAYFSMLRRMAVEKKVWGTDDFFSIDQMDGASTRWPLGAASYFMGYQLYHELWSRKGADGVRQLIDTSSKTFPYFLNHPFTTTYGENYKTLWETIFRQTSAHEEKEIARIKNDPLSFFTEITQSKFAKWDLHLSPQNHAVFRSYRPDSGSNLEIWDFSKKERLRTIEDKFGGTEGLCFLEGNSGFLVNVQTSQNGYVTHEVKRYDWEKDSLSSLGGESPKNVVTLACSENAEDVVLYREKALHGEVVWYRYDAKKNELNRKKSWVNPHGTWASSLSFHSGGVWIAVRRETETDFYRWKNTSPEQVRTAPGHFHSMRPLDADAFLAIASIDGRDEIWIVDPTRNTLQKHAAFLGGVSSFDWKHKTLLALGYQHGGYDLVEVKPVAVPSKALGNPKPSSTASPPAPSISMAHEYSPWGTLVPRAWIPLFLFVPDGVQVGFWIPGFDISQRYYYDVIGGYDSRGSAFGSLGFSHRFNHKRLLLSTQYSPNYLRLGGELSLLARGGAQVALDTSFDDFSMQITGIISRLFDERPNLTHLDSVGGSATLGYSFGFSKGKPLDVTARRGTAISVSSSYYPSLLRSSEEYYVITGRLDQYAPSPFRHHGFFLGLRGGITHGTQLRNSFFEVGGEILFASFRQSFFNRGFTPARFAAREVGNANLEYRFLIATIERGYGLLPFKIRRLQGAVVADISTVDSSSDHLVRDQFGKVYYVSSGFELKSDWIFSYYLPSQLRMGLYHGFGPIGEPLYFSVAIEAAI